MILFVPVRAQQCVQIKGKLSVQSEAQREYQKALFWDQSSFLYSRMAKYMPLSIRTEHTVDMCDDDFTISATTVRSIEHNINNDLQKIIIWCDENRNVINAKNKGHDYHDSTKVPTLQHNWSRRLLRLRINHFLTWNTHIQNTHKHDCR